MVGLDAFPTNKEALPATIPEVVVLIPLPSTVISSEVKDETLAVEELACQFPKEPEKVTVGADRF